MLRLLETHQGMDGPVVALWNGLIPAPDPKKTRVVSHCGLAIYMKKYLKTKEELGKLKYFTMLKNDLQKIL
jgi:hypothetical protein